ncbi:shikimate kinase [Sinomonas halotolerans]|uniref:Shikimate kinase n=1 Tax=Sinomonas halotolerans TaxID=1644133 RepID=A0ABU9WZH4_9MICC
MTSAHCRLDRPVVLFGPMAAGKTSVGRALSEITGAPFLDTDALVVAEHGPIPEIFASLGEQAFRDFEAAAVARALEDAGPAGLVLALGGGAVLREETRVRLSGAHRVYLTASWEDVAPRLAGCSDRPLLQGDAEARWKALMETRGPVFESLATLRVPTGGPTAAAVAASIAEAIAAPCRIDQGVQA